MRDLSSKHAAKEPHNPLPTKSLDTSQNSKRKNAVPYTLSLSVLAGVIFFITLLIPSQEEIIHRLLLDGEYDRIKQIIASIPEQTRPKHSLIYTVAELRIDRRDAQNVNKNLHLNDQPARDLLDRGLNAYDDFEFTEDFAIELGETLGATPSLEVCESYFPLITQKLSPKDFKTFSQLLTKQSHSVGNPVPRIYLKRHEINDGDRSIENLKTLIGLWRSQNRQAEALTDIEAFLSFVTPHEAHLADLGTVYGEKLKLLCELNRSSEAFDLIVNHREHFEYQLGVQESLAVLETAAQQSNRTRDLLPQYLAWTERFPQDQKILLRYAELALALGEEEQALEGYKKLVKKNASNPDYRLQLAQILEWNDEAGKAFDHYQMLAMQGNARALDRMISLNPGLYRDRELIEGVRYQISFLEKSDNTNSSRKAQLTHKLAELLVRQGNYDEAKDTFHDYLAADTKIPLKKQCRTLMQLGDLHMELHAFEEAYASYLKVIELNPAHEIAHLNLAHVDSMLGEYDRAIARLRLLSEKNKSLEIINQYLVISQTLGYIEDRIQAQKLLIEATSRKNLVPELYQTLAHLHYLNQDHQSSLSTLVIACEKFPNNKEIKLRLIQQLYDAQKYSEAIALIEPIATGTSHPRAQKLYIYLLLATKQHQKAATYLSQLDQNLQDSPELTETIAYLYIQNGEFSKAKDLYITLYKNDPKNYEIAEMLAYIYYKMSDRQSIFNLIQTFNYNNNPRFHYLAAELYADINFPKRALLHMEHYCHVNRKLDSETWRLIADLQEQSGNRQKAKSSYEKSLSETVKNLRNDSPDTDIINVLNINI